MSARQPSTWRMAWRIARYRPGLFCLGLAQTMAWNGSTLVVGWLLQEVFDALSGDKPAGLGVYEILALLAGAEAAKLGVMWAGAVESRCWEQMRGLLRLNLLRAQLRGGGPEAGTPVGSPGEAVSRFRDDVDDFLGFLDTAVDVAGKVVLVGGSMIIMLSIEPVIAVAVVLPLLAVVAVTRTASGQIRRHRTAYRHASAAVTALLGELFSAVLTVKAAHAGSGLQERLALLNNRRRRAGLRDQLVTQLLSAFNRGVMDLSVGIVLLLALPAMRRGTLTVGELALFVSYVGMLIWAPLYTGRLIARHRQAGVSIERLASLLPPTSPEALVIHRSLKTPDLPQRVAHRGRSALTRLTVSGLTAIHSPSRRGVHDIDLVLERGSFTVVTGPAGAGKTTLLRAILGLLPRQSGTLLWNGAVVGDPADFLVPPRSAYVPQVPRLFSDSLRDNLTLGLTLGNDEPADLSAMVRTAVLDQDVATMPAGLDTKVGARGVRLSGGQVQRAAIARALVPRTDLLVLDDVSSALDVETEARLWNRLLTGRHQTLLVVSNRPATIARADSVIRLDHGRVQEDPIQALAAKTDAA